VAELAEYDPAWVGRFEVEAVLIAGALGEVARQIEHVGSTSVPGLAAKPTIDVAVGVDRLDVVLRHVEPMAAAGFVYQPDQGRPGNGDSSRATGSPGT
jgi:GrpB-like predicted nucleotidyltransferase (UPF0157 family)